VVLTFFVLAVAGRIYSVKLMEKQGRRIFRIKFLNLYVTTADLELVT